VLPCVVALEQLGVEIRELQRLVCSGAIIVEEVMFSAE